MMGAIRPRRIQTLLVFLFALSLLTVQLMASKINHVVFQSFFLAEGETVQCYGRCDGGKAKVSRCDGRKIRFACASGEQVRIQKAIVGDLNPDNDICTHERSLKCNVTDNVQTICANAQQCLVDSEHFKDNCLNIRHLAMDIKYVCEVKPTDRSETTITQTSNRNVKIKGKATKPSATDFPLVDKNPQIIVETIVPSPFMTHSTKSTFLTKNIQTKRNKTIITLQKSTKTNMFWFMTAFTAITDNEFINKNKTHLAMALLLSMFVGMVLSLCFCLDYCRRQKRKRDSKCLLDSKMALVQELHATDSNERIELTKQIMMEVISVNGSLPRHKIIACNDGSLSCHNNNNGDCEIYAVSPSFPQRNYEHKSMVHNRVSPRQEKQFSTGSLPPPPNHFLVESSSSSSNELSQTNDFSSSSKTHSSCEMKKSRWPSGSIHSTLSNSKKGTPLSKCNSEVLDVEETFLEEAGLNERREDSKFEYVEVGQYNANISDNECDEYSSSPRNARSMTYHRTDNYVVPSNVKFASMSRRTANKDDASHDDSKFRTLDLKRMRKSSAKDRPALHKSRSVDEPKRKTYFSSNGTQYVLRDPRRGRIHVMERCQGSVAQRSVGYTHKGIYSDNEASRRRRRCQVEYKRTCSCSDQGTSLSDLHCKRCGKAEESHMTCCSSLTSNCQSSHDEDHGPLLSVSNERMKNKHCRVEESGYQTHDTGTDSLCSSTFSTDQEDSRMFLPASVHRRCRCCAQASKRDEKLIFVRSNHNKSKIHRHNSHACVDMHSYDSSMDDENIRNENYGDSFKIIRKIRKPNDGGLGGLDEDMNFKCNRGAVSPKNMGTASGIETT